MTKTDVFAIPLSCRAAFVLYATNQVIRNDADLPPQLLAAQQQRYAYMHPSIASRTEGAQTVRARWAVAAAAAQFGAASSNSSSKPI